MEFLFRSLRVWLPSYHSEIVTLPLQVNNSLIHVRRSKETTGTAALEHIQSLRGKMNADEFRDYNILGLIFYKYLSERMNISGFCTFLFRVRIKLMDTFMLQKFW